MESYCAEIVVLIKRKCRARPGLPPKGIKMKILVLIIVFINLGCGITRPLECRQVYKANQISGGYFETICE